MLERSGLPATVFVASGFLDTGRTFWSATLARVLLTTPTLPADLRLAIRGVEHAWALGDVRTISDDGMGRWRAWRGWDPSPPTARHRVLQALYPLLLRLPHDDRQRVVDEVVAWPALTLSPSRRHGV